MHFLVVGFAGWLNRQQQAVIEYLKTANEIFKSQINIVAHAIDHPVRYLERVAQMPDELISVLDPGAAAHDRNVDDLSTIRKSGASPRIVLTANLCGSMQHNSTGESYSQGFTRLCE